MPRYVIERQLPGAGRLSAEEVRGVAQRSCAVLKELGSDIQWVESYVTDDTIYCVYLAPSEELIREHARRGGFPANRIARVKRSISPLTAEEGQPAATHEP
jgi:cell division inhibitor SulA